MSVETITIDDFQKVPVNSISQRFAGIEPDGTDSTYSVESVRDYIIRAVTPEQFRSEVIVTDLQCLQAAIDSGLPVLIEKTYSINGTANILDDTTIFGYGENSRLTSVASTPLVLIQGKRNTIFNITLEGDADAGGSQHGISITGAEGADADYVGNIISLCRGLNLAGAMIYMSYNTKFFRGNQISDCSADSCGSGVFFDHGGEYNTVSNFSAWNCNFGIRNIGGNNSFSNCNLSYNNYGFYLGADSNNGHCSMVGGKINHSVSHNIYADGCTLGYTFDGVAIYGGVPVSDFLGKIWIKNSSKVSVQNCMISVAELDFENSTSIKIHGNTFAAAPTSVTNYDIGSVWWSNNVYDGVRLAQDTIPEYADNAAALIAGLQEGMQYRTGDALKTVH